MKFGYVVVVEADKGELHARARLEEALERSRHVQLVGGGAGISSSHAPYLTGPIAAVIAKDAYEGDEDQCEVLSIALHAEAIR